MRLERFRALGGAARGGRTKYGWGWGHLLWGLHPARVRRYQGCHEDALHRMQNDVITLTPQGGGDPGRAEGLY